MDWQICKNISMREFLEQTADSKYLVTWKEPSNEELLQSRILVSNGLYQIPHLSKTFFQIGNCLLEEYANRGIVSKEYMIPVIGMANRLIESYLNY